jgi:hypothetical protein
LFPTEENKVNEEGFANANFVAFVAFCFDGFLPLARAPRDERQEDS